MSDSTGRYPACSARGSQNTRMPHAASRPLIPGALPLSRRELYGRKAMECLLAADGMTNFENRIALVKLAQCWMQLGARSNDILDRANRQVTALLSRAETAQHHHGS
jgi:hypothetical protein